MLSDEDWQRILELNLLTAVRLDRAFLPGMRERKSGVFIHISSVAHRLPLSNSTLAYATAKGALTTYSKGLAKGVAPKGVRVTMIFARFIETSGAYGMIADIARGSGIGENAARQRIVEMLGGISIGWVHDSFVSKTRSQPKALLATRKEKIEASDKILTIIWRWHAF